MFIILTIVCLVAWLVVVLYKYTKKRFLKHLVMQNLSREFEEELNNRVRAHFVLSTDPELLNLMLESQNKKEGDVDVLSIRIDKVREIEREKMLGEKHYGLTP
jgi:hypothetical protein